MSALEELDELRERGTQGRRLFYTICSIYPWELVQERPQFQPKPIYRLAAVKRGEAPSYVTFGDQQQMEGLPGSLTGRRTVTIFAHELAADLMDHYTKHGLLCGEDAHPGVWICAGDEPTADEIAEAERVQANYFSRLVAQADEIYVDEKRRQILNSAPIFKIAAEWLRIEGRPWQQAISSNTFIKCPWCKKSIEGDSIVCAHCTNVVNAEAYAKRKADIDRHLKATEPAAATPRPVAPPVAATVAAPIAPPLQPRG